MRVCARLTNQLLSTLTSFDRRMRDERTLVQTLASQLSSTLILVCPGLTSPSSQGIRFRQHRERARTVQESKTELRFSSE